ncbi:MAG: PBSX family phage terminase large subunit [bacterium]|nr:PBSX family phage terminase large subunit [bacterium]
MFLPEYAPAQSKAIRNCNKFFNLLHGAVRSGKTWIANQIWINHVYTTDYDKFLMTGHSKATLKRNVLDDVIDLIGINYCKYNSTDGELKIPGGKVIYTVGATDAKAERKIRGATFGGCYSDELTLHPRTTLDMIPTRLSVPGAKWFATTNPDSPFHYIYKTFIKNTPKNAYVQRFTIEDNPSLTDEFKENLKMSLTGLFYRRMFLGEWVLADGLIYDMVNEDNFVDELPKERPMNIIIGSDYGTASVTTFLLIYVYKDCLYVVDEYVYDARSTQVQKTDYEFVNEYKNFTKNIHINGVYLDKSAVSFKQELVNSCVCTIREANNDVINGIRSVASLFMTGRLKILNRCVTLREELTSSYIWDEGKQMLGIDAPLKENDHCCDALRYAVYSYMLNGNTASYFASGSKIIAQNTTSDEVIRDKVLQLTELSQSSKLDETLASSFALCQEKPKRFSLHQPRNFRQRRSSIHTMLR